MFDILLLGVWISDKTLLLIFDILLPGVWISDKTLLLLFDILLLGVWISDKTLLLVFDILLFGVCIYRIKHSFSSLTEVLRDVKTNLFLLLHLHCFASDDFY